MVGALRQDVARLHEHVEKVDDKMDAQSMQMAVLDTHVTRLIKERSETDLKVDAVEGKVDAVDRKVDQLTNKVLGGMAVISFILFVAAELIRIWFH